jgi:hypothetical protein
MRLNDMLVREIPLSFLLALTLASCNATSLTEHQGAVPQKLEAPQEISQYIGTYMFDLVDTKMNKKRPMTGESKSYSAAFTKLTEDLVKHDRRFIERITSGPSTKGIAVKSEQDDAVIHVTCQAHACNQAVLAVMFVPRSGRMVALLWDQCARTELGSPTHAESEVLTRTGKIPLNTQENRNKCESEH